MYNKVNIEELYPRVSRQRCRGNDRWSGQSRCHSAEQNMPLSIIRRIKPPLTAAAGGQNSQYWFICLVFTCKFFRHISYWSSSWLEGLTESQLFWMNRIWESPGAGKVEVCVRFLLCHNLRLRGRFRNTSINLSLKWMTHFTQLLNISSLFEWLYLTGKLMFSCRFVIYLLIS